MKSNRVTIFVMLLILGGAGFAFSVVYGDPGEDLDAACSIAAAWELDPSAADDEKLAGAFQEIGTLKLAPGTSEIFGAVAQAAPDQKYALLLRSAHADGNEAYQCPALQRLLNPFPAGSASRDWLLFCDLLAELDSLPGLPPLEREHRVLRRIKMEPGNAKMRAALESPTGERLAAVMEAAIAEEGRTPLACGLEKIWPASKSE